VTTTSAHKRLATVGISSIEESAFRLEDVFGRQLVRLSLRRVRDVPVSVRNLGTFSVVVPVVLAQRLHSVPGASTQDVGAVHDPLNRRPFHSEAGDLELQFSAVGEATPVAEVTPTMRAPSVLEHPDLVGLSGVIESAHQKVLRETMIACVSWHGKMPITVRV